MISQNYSRIAIGANEIKRKVEIMKLKPGRNRAKDKTILPN